MAAALFTAVLVVELSGAALLAAACLSRRSTVRWLLVGYVVLFAETTAITTALSPFRLVTRRGLAAAATALLGGAVVWWLRSGRPRPHLPAVRRPASVGTAVALLAVAFLSSVLYQLVLILVAPPNNWDSLTYHLARTAAWAQHGGVLWISDAPTERMNEFQPLAEQQILVLFVAMGRAALFALPQFLAELAIVAAVYEAARKLGHTAHAAAFAALLVGTFPLIALEATTAQNDLVAASLCVAAAALILGGTRAELVVAGIAVGLALGVKLTALFGLPVILLLALRRGRRSFSIVAAAGSAAFLLLGMWSFVLNLIHSGHLLGHGSERITHQAPPSLVGSPTTAFRILYGLLDLSGLSLHLTDVLAAVGFVLALAVFIAALHQGATTSRAVVAGAFVAVPLLASRFIPVFAHGVHLAADAVRLPVNAPATTDGRFFWGVDFGVSEDLSAFGVVGGPLLLAASLWFVTRRERASPRFALALALPLFVVLLALSSKYNPWLARLLIVPAALGAPLLASLAARRGFATAIACVAVVQLGLVHVRNEQKPLTGPHRITLGLTQSDALLTTFRPDYAQVTRNLSRLVPAAACLGAAVGPDDPSFLLFGARFDRRVTFLPRQRAAAAATARSLRLVVLAQGSGAAAFARRGWLLRPLSRGERPPWTLAIAPAGAAHSC